jgi:hypothetical protein
MDSKEQMKVLSEGGSFRRRFPSFPKSFPMAWFNEEYAQRNHGQSLARLNERGGLSVQEMVLNIKQQDLRHFSDLSEEQACKWLLSYQQEK